MSTAIAGLLELLDQSYQRKAWHGPNLRGSIRGLTAEQAAWRPQIGRHSIAEQVLHAAYWKYTVRRRINGEKQGSFPRPGSNWFALDEATFTQAAWKEVIALLDSTHRSLRAAIESLDEAQLDTIPHGSKHTYRALIQGIALHDVYHAGQISLLKRMQKLED